MKIAATAALILAIVGIFLSIVYQLVVPMLGIHSAAAYGVISFILTVIHKLPVIILAIGILVSAAPQADRQN